MRKGHSGHKSQGDRIIFCGRIITAISRGIAVIIEGFTVNGKITGDKIVIKTLFFDVGYAAADESDVWKKRCEEPSETKEAKPNIREIPR